MTSARFSSGWAAARAMRPIRAVFIRMGRGESDAAAVLKRRLLALDGEIETRRAHQCAILKLLKNDSIGRKKMITKEKWVSIMKASGLTDVDIAPLACGVREGGAGRASGVSRIPAHPGSGDPKHPGFEPGLYRPRKSRLKGFPRGDPGPDCPRHKEGSADAVDGPGDVTWRRRV